MQMMLTEFWLTVALSMGSISLRGEGGLSDGVGLSLDQGDVGEQAGSYAVRLVGQNLR